MAWNVCVVLFTPHIHMIFCSPSAQRFLFVSPPTPKFSESLRKRLLELWMLLWVRRIPHAERSGRFRLSPGEVKNPRFEAGDGHMPSPSPWGLISNTVSFTSQKGRDLRFPGTAGWAFGGRILSFPGVSPSSSAVRARTERALLNQHVVGAAHQ